MSIIDVIRGKAPDAREGSEYSTPSIGSDVTLFKGLVRKFV